MIKPNLYCDVDGVLNATARYTDTKTHWVSLRPHLFNRFPAIPHRIQLREKITHQLSQLKVNFLWLTAWNHQAVKVLEPITGIKSQEVLHYNFRPIELFSHKSKYELLKQHQKRKPTPFIWVDDIATKHFRDQDFSSSTPKLIIQTHIHHGLTENQMKKIESFILNPLQKV